MKRVDLTKLHEWSQAKIKRELTELNSRFINAGNAFEMCICMLDMLEIMRADLEYWRATSKDLQEQRQTGWESFKKIADEQFEKSEEQIDLILAELKEQYKKAIEIQEAMMNDYKLLAPVLLPYDEMFSDE